MLSKFRKQDDSFLAGEGAFLVNGFRGETSELDLMKKRIDLDLWYIDNWSFWLDLWIIVRTCFEIVRGRNAY